MEIYYGYIKGVYEESVGIGGWTMRVYTMNPKTKELSKTATCTNKGVDYYSDAVRMGLTAAINVLLEVPEKAEVNIVTNDSTCEALLLNTTRKEEYQDLVDRLCGIYCRKQQKVGVVRQDSDFIYKLEGVVNESISNLVAVANKDVSKDRDCRVIFAKGCCNDENQFPRKGGWAFAMYDGKSAVKVANPMSEDKGLVRGESSDNRMELRAIAEAVQTLPKGSKVWILTDSKYCIQVLDHRTKDFKYNSDYIKCFYKTIVENRIAYEFKWVKENSGNAFHERVCSMAKEDFDKEGDKPEVDWSKFGSEGDFMPDIVIKKPREKKKLKAV